MKKRFKDTKVGGFLAKAAPQVLDLIGDVYPPVELLANLVRDKAPDLDIDQRSEFYETLEHYELDLKYHTDNTTGARGIYSRSKDMTDSLATKIMNWNLPLILFLILINIACVKYLDSALLAIISNVVGMAMQKLFEERSAVTNFFFGSSVGSKEKDNFLNTNKNDKTI